MRLGGRGGAGFLPEQKSWTCRKQVPCATNVTHSIPIVKAVYRLTSYILDKRPIVGERGRNGRSSLVAILALHEGGRVSRSEAGGKAVQLSELSYLGIPIPQTWVIPISTFRWLSQRNADVACPMDWRVPTEMTDAWLSVVEKIGGPVAVRSSACNEDGTQYSFAGQYETVLNVHREGVIAAIRRCWRSLFENETYGHRSEDDAMAVVIQPMVDAAVSGVMFTMNPMNGSWREMSIEAVWGQCEGLVSGRISPHWYLVRRPRGRLARIRLSVIQSQVHPILEQMAPGENGVLEMVPVPKRRQQQPTLRPAELFRLCRIGMKIQRHFEAPQDVEWARTASGDFVVLQSRPITARAEPRRRTDVVWTRRFLGERWPSRVTPLGWSLVAPILEHFIAYPQTQAELLGGGEALQLVHARPYLNASIFPHLAFKLPGMPAPHFLLELMPPDEVEVWHRKFAVMPDFAVYRSVLRHTISERRWRRFGWNPFTNFRQWQRFEEQANPRLAVLNRTPRSLSDARALVEEQLQLTKEYVGIHVCSLLFANIWDQVLEGFLAGRIPDHARALHRGLAVCPPGNKTLACNQALFELAQHLGVEGIDALHEDVPLSASHQTALDRFLADYGNRSQSSWEIFAPRWKEAPSRLVPYLLSMKDGASPMEAARGQQQRFERAEQLLQTNIGLGERWIAGQLVTLVREYLLLRENQRFFFERLFGQMKETLLWVGNEWVKQGILSRSDEIQFASWSLICDTISGAVSPEVCAETIGNAEHIWRNAEDKQAPDFLRGERPLELDIDARRLQGLGISEGRVKGVVRILTTPEDGQRLHSGDILVARSVDPGWTPLFGVAGGIILELGGRLSHGAVVAREYGLPGVVQIEGATKRLSDGQTVILDGQQGIVWVQD